MYMQHIAHIRTLTRHPFPVRQAAVLAEKYAALLGTDMRMEAEEEAFGLAALKLLASLVQMCPAVRAELLAQPDRCSRASCLQPSQSNKCHLNMSNAGAESKHRVGCSMSVQYKGVRHCSAGHRAHHCNQHAWHTTLLRQHESGMLGCCPCLSSMQQLPPRPTLHRPSSQTEQSVLSTPHKSAACPITPQNDR